MSGRPRRETKPSARARDVAEAKSKSKSKATNDETPKVKKVAAKKKAAPKAKKASTSSSSSSTSKKRKKNDSSSSEGDNDNGANDGSGSDNDTPIAKPRPTTARAAAAAAKKAAKTAAAAASSSATATTTTRKGGKKAKTETKDVATYSVGTIVMAKERRNVKGDKTRIRLILHSPPDQHILDTAVVPTASSASTDSGDVTSHFFLVCATDHRTCGNVEPLNVTVRPLPSSIIDNANAITWGHIHMRGIMMPYEEMPENWLSAYHHGVAAFRQLILERQSAKPAAKQSARVNAKKGRAAQGAIGSNMPSAQFAYQPPYYTTRTQRLAAGVYGISWQIGECTNDGMIVMNAGEPLSSSNVRPNPQTYSELDALFIDVLGPRAGQAADLETRPEDTLSICSGDTNFDCEHAAANAFKAEMKAADVKGETFLNKTKPKKRYNGDGNDDGDGSDGGGSGSGGDDDYDRWEGMVAERALFHKYIDLSHSDAYQTALNHCKTTQPQIQRIICGDDTHRGVTPLIPTIGAIIGEYLQPIVVTEDMIRRHRVEKWLAANRGYCYFQSNNVI